MLLLGKRPADLTEEDLRDFVDRGLCEGDRLEFKRDMYGRDDESKRELLRDVTAMANARGGHILIGVEEDGDSCASSIVGVQPEDNASWMRSLLLAGIEDRIVGLDVVERSLSAGAVVFIIHIPESANAPHMVTFRGLNQFWKRYGTQKERMSVEEIRETVARVLDNEGRIDRFFEHRHNGVYENVRGRTFLILQALPSYFRQDQEIINPADPAIRRLMLEPPGNYPNIGSGQPYRTLEGLRANQRTPYMPMAAPTDASYLEVWRNGYVEFGVPLNPHGEDLHFAAVADASYLISFSAFLAHLYERVAPGTPLVMRCMITFATGMWLATRGREMSSAVRWQHDTLDLAQFFVEDISTEYKLLAKRICDRLWNAFHLEEATVFDSEGNLRPTAG